MDLIYTNEKKEELGILLDYSLDLAFGSGENDFELEVVTDNNVCVPQGWFYIDGTEYGGIIDSVTVDTELKKITYAGRTYHGILNSKIIEPNLGEDYFKVNGELNTIIKELIDRMGLSSIFKASADITEKSINNYHFPRYISGYDGIAKMLSSVGYKLKVIRKEDYIELSAIPIVDYSTDEELDSDQVRLKITQINNNVNHLICLGRGELKNREIIHLYADDNGKIKDTQFFYGEYEYTEIFDYPNSESAQELKDSGIKRFKEILSGNVLEVNLDNKYQFDIGDKIMARENITGISVIKRVIKKIVTIKKGHIKINYKVGE